MLKYQVACLCTQQGGISQSRGAATLGELLQRMLHLLSRPDEAAAVVENIGMDTEACAAAGPGGGEGACGGPQALSACAKAPGVPCTRQLGSRKRKAPDAQPGERDCQQAEALAGAECSCKRQDSMDIAQVRRLFTTGSGPCKRPRHSGPETNPGLCCGGPGGTGGAADSDQGHAAAAAAGALVEEALEWRALAHRAVARTHGAAGARPVPSRRASVH